MPVNAKDTTGNAPFSLILLNTTCLALPLAGDSHALLFTFEIISLKPEAISYELIDWCMVVLGK